MGRAPCCDKANVKKGPWSPEEDEKLKSYIEKHGTGGNWIALPQKIGLKRCGKSCRLRWLNYLRPNLKHGGFSEEEDNIICNLYSSIGSRWSVIAAQLPGRTDNDIKNYWNTRLKKKLLGKHRKEQQARVNNSLKQPRINRGSYMNSVVPGEITGGGDLQPYWPELPVLASGSYPTQEPSFNDHDSIRKLLIKLGGRFSDVKENTTLDGKHNLQFIPVGPYSPAPAQPYEQQITTFPSSSCMNATQYFVEAETSVGVGFMEDMIAVSTDEQRLHNGLEFLCGDEDMVDYKMLSCNIHGSCWGESSSHQSQVYPSFVASSYEDMRQDLSQECGYHYQELRCQDPQFQALHL